MEVSSSPMNSETLQRTHPLLYEDFFSRCAVVCSAPRLRPMTGDHTVPYGGMMMAHRQPLRNFVGLEFLREPLIRVHHRVHVPGDGEIDFAFTRLFEERIVPIVREFIQASDIRGIGIHFLTEGPPARITGSYNGGFAALSAALHLAVGAVTPEVLQQWTVTPTRELLSNPSLSFDPIYRFALRLKSALDLNIEGGGLVFTAFLTSASPTLFFWKKTYLDLQDVFPRSLRFLNLDQAMHAASVVPYWGINVSEVVEERLHVPFTWPIDILSINMGEVVRAGYAQQMLSTIESNVRTLIDVIDEEFEPFLAHGDPLPPSYHSAKGRGGEYLWYSINQVAMTLTLKTIARFLALFTHGDREQEMLLFMRAADTHRYLLSVLDFGIPRQNHLAAHLHNRMRTLKLGRIAVKPYAHGGEVLVLAPYGTCREALLEEIYYFKKKNELTCTIDYLSWRDGFGREGLQVDQDAHAGILSRFLGDASTQVFFWDDKGKRREVILPHQKVVDERALYDLFLDEGESAIYVCGRKLTSKELHSTTMTLEILHCLFRSLDMWVPASDLTQSSYIDRNEMQSKIVTPLRAAVKKYAKKDLSIEVQGSIGSDFSMRFSPKETRIGLICKNHTEV